MFRDKFVRYSLRPLLTLASLLIAGSLLAQQSQDLPESSLPLKLVPGEKIALVGNSLAERMNLYGHFETYLHLLHQDRKIVVRNFARPADAVNNQQRSADYTAIDDPMKVFSADTYLCFFGFNESFKGPEGVSAFKTNLDRWVKETQAKNYSGKGGPRLVLVSPVGAERHKDPNFPDPAPLNANLKLYADAMAEVAKANDVQFVDLFTPSLLT